MTIGKKFTYPIVLIGVLLAVVVSIFYARQQFRAQQESRYQANERFLEYYFFKEEEILSSISRAIESDEQIVENLAKRDRAGLYDALAPLWKSYERDSFIDEMRIFLPDSTLWLDMANRERTMDDGVCITRGDISFSKKESSLKSYLYICSSFVGIRYALDIFDGSGEKIAVISIGKRLDSIPQEFKKYIDIDTALFFDKETLFASLSENHRARYEGEVGEFIKIADKIDKKILDAVDITKKVDYLGFLDGFFISRIPLIDIRGENIGYMLFFDRDENFSIGLLKEVVLLAVVISLFLFLVLAATFKNIATVKGNIKNLSNRLSKVASLDFSDEEKRRDSGGDELELLMDETVDMSKRLRAHNEDQQRISSEKDRMLIQQSKMASVGEMLKIISHQWKQPLSAVSLSVLLIQDEVIGREDLEQEFRDEMNYHFENIMHNISFMDGTVKYFKEFLRENREEHRFDIVEVTMDMCSLMSSIFKHSSISIEPPQDIARRFHVLGIENEYKQVVMNLLSNAKDALIEHRKSGRKIKIDFRDVDGKVVVEFYDNGGGLKEEVLPSIFENRFTTKGENGDGIGLYISKVIIEKHMRGALVAENGEEGAIFRITLESVKDGNE